MKTEPNFLGIDRPVIACRDLDSAFYIYERLGFKPAPRNHDPWGTAANQILFPRGSIELLGLEDKKQLDLTIPPNRRVYTAFVRDFLKRREGFLLTALQSDDLERDQNRVEALGLVRSERIAFRRNGRSPAGSVIANTALVAMLINAVHPNLSLMLCQRHKPPRASMPNGQDHPNQTDGIHGVVYLADEPNAVLDYFQALYGAERVHRTSSGLEISNPNGAVSVLASGMIGHRFPEFEDLLPPSSERPCGIAISLHTRDINAVIACLAGAGVPFTHDRQNLIRVGPNYAGGVVLEFVGD